MKLYKIKKNKDGTSEIIEEIYGQTLEPRKGWQELTDEEAAELRQKVYNKKQEKIKSETKKVLEKHFALEQEKGTALKNVSDEIQDRLNTKNTDSEKTITSQERERFETAQRELEEVEEQTRLEVLSKHKEVIEEETEEQKRSYIVIEKARETAKLRAEHVKQKREEINIANRNKKEMIIKKTNQFKEEAIDKINSSKNISSKQKKYEIEKLQADIEKALSKWGL